MQCISPGHGGLSVAGGEGSSDMAATKVRPWEVILPLQVESMLVMSGGEGYIDFRIGE